MLNVGLALARLGAPCVTLAPLGGVAAKLIEQEFAAIGIRRQWIDVVCPTRECTTILDVASGLATELVENAGPLSHVELERFAEAFADLAAEARLVVITGSLPAGAPSSYVRDLAAAAAHCPVILDVRGAELREALARKPLVVKPNREELALTVGEDLRDDAALRRAMHDMNERGAQWVVVTAGAEPLWASSEGRFYRARACDVHVANPIGSGDCLTAGLAWGIVQGQNPLAALSLGVAAAAENVGQLLPARFEPAAVQKRRSSVVVEAV